RHQRLDALVDVTEPLFEANHILAVGGETEMTGLDDPRVHRTDCDLVQTLAFARQEPVRPAVARRGGSAERRGLRPNAVIEPGPRIGRSDGVKTKEIADGALKPQRRRVARGDAREFSGFTFETDDGNLIRGAEQRQMHGRSLAPEAEQRDMTCGEQVDRLEPSLLANGSARPWPVGGNHLLMRNEIE